MKEKDIFAFPVGGGHGTVGRGMTLRDYFAAKAMHGSLASAVGEINAEDLAALSYRMADVMLKARQK